MNITELRSKKEAELKEALKEQRQAMFKLRMQRGTGDLARPDQMKKARRQIARIHTLLNEQKKAVAHD